jgi:hypothetical protein
MAFDDPARGSDPAIHKDRHEGEAIHGHEAGGGGPPGLRRRPVEAFLRAAGVAPRAIQGLYLAVHDIEAARADLVRRGVAVSEIFHRMPGTAPLPGPDPERRSYASFATFRDPDGNGWLLQELRQRLPGRGSVPPAA